MVVSAYGGVIVATFGELLAELRQDKGLTQKQLGRVLSVSTGTISNYENGVHYPDLEKLVALADYFQVSTDYLLGRENSTRTVHISEAKELQDERIIRLIHRYSQLPKDRQQALDLIMTDMEQAVLPASKILAQGDGRKC